MFLEASSVEEVSLSKKEKWSPRRFVFSRLQIASRYFLGWNEANFSQLDFLYRFTLMLIHHEIRRSMITANKNYNTSSLRETLIKF